MFLVILEAQNALSGTFAPYRPPYFNFWAPGVWARGTWGMNDEWTPASGGGGGAGPAKTSWFYRRRRFF